MPTLPEPKCPTGTSPEAQFMRWVYHTLVSLKPMDTPNAQWNRTGKGWGLRVTAPAGTGLKVATYHYKSMTTEGLSCRTWDGTTEGTQIIYIAKPPKLRYTVTSEVIDGVTVTYSAYSGQTRHAAGSNGQSENQAIVPRYLVDDVIFAVSCYTGALEATAAITLLDLNIDGRAWMATS